MGRVARIWYRRNNHRWVDIIDGICQSYNATFHTSIHEKPKDVTDENSASVFYHLYKDIIGKSPGKPKYTIGQKVHVSGKKTLFGKKYMQQYSPDVYIIKDVIMTNPITYKLISDDGEEAISSYYPEELVPASSSN